MSINTLHKGDDDDDDDDFFLLVIGNAIQFEKLVVPHLVKKFPEIHLN